MSPIDARKALSYWLPIGREPTNRLVSETFSIKSRRQTDTYTQTYAHIDTSTDNKGRLELALQPRFKPVPYETQDISAIYNTE